MATASNKIFFFLLCLAIAFAVDPPSPVCRTAPLPSTIPISIGETGRFDLEDIFDGT